MIGIKKNNGDIHAVSSRETAKVATKKVWKIFHFSERFVFDDDRRKNRVGPLAATRGILRAHVSDETATYHQQMTVLKTRPNRLELRGAFEDIKEISACRCGAYRGYLVALNREPASVRTIAAWLGVPTSKAIKILEDLEQIGLIERVDIPDFDKD